MLRVSSLRGLVALALSCASCGARSELAAADASPPTSPVPLACKVPAVGGIVWQTSFPTDQRWTGPWAADDEGATYYLGEDLGSVPPSSYSILAVDACGKVKWRSDARPTASFDGAKLGVVVTGDRVLFQSGIIDALDRATGALLWSVDLDAFANERLALDDGAEISALAVTSDGSAFFTMTYETRKIMAVIDGAGAITRVTDVSGDSGDISGFLVDAEGHLDVLWNSPAGAILTSYTPEGSEVFSRPFTCQTGFIGGLAAGSSFVVMQSGPCGMDLTGKNLFGAIGSGKFVTIDAANNLYFLALAGLASQEATGALRWSVPLSTSLVSAPLLATNGQLFTAEVAAPGSDSDGPLYVVAHDTSSGVELARYPTGTTSPGPLDVMVRLTAVGEAVVGLESGAVALWVGQSPDSTAQWPTESGGADGRNVAQGQ